MTLLLLGNELKLFSRPYWSVGSLHATSIALSLTRQYTLATVELIVSDTFNSPTMWLPLNMASGALFWTTGTGDTSSEQKLSLGAEPGSPGAHQGAPSYCTIAAGCGFFEDTQTAALENVAFIQ